MHIIDATSKEREIRNIKIKTYEIPDKTGEPKNVVCVEYTVIGKHSEWRDFMTMEEFAVKNPEINL